MLKKDQVIVIHCQKHSDKANILHTYSLQNGRENFVFYRGRKRAGMEGGIPNLPLVILEVCYDDQKTREMKVIQSVNPIFIPLADDSEKQCIRMILGEVLYKTLRHPMADERIYQFVAFTIRQLDTAPKAQALLRPFLHHFSELLGYGGEWVEEWNSLSSLDLLREMLD